MDKRQPTLLGIGCPHWAVAQVLPYGPGRYANPEFQLQLVGDTFLAPDRVVRSHRPDQLSEVLGQARSSDWFGLPAPETTEILCAAIGSAYPASRSPANYPTGTFGSGWPSSSGWLRRPVVA